MPITLQTWNVNKMPRAAKGKFASNPLLKLVANLQKYRPTSYFKRVITLTRFDHLFVDPKAKNILDQFTAVFYGRSSGFSDVTFVETLKELVGDEARIVERLRPGAKSWEADNFDLMIVAGKANIKLLDRAEQLGLLVTE